MPDPVRLALIHAACFTTPRPWPAHEMLGLMGLTTSFVLEEEGGFVMGNVAASEAEVLTLAVHPDHRRKGVGARLMAGFLATAKAKGADRAFLEVAENNPAAIALYAQAGFDKAGRRKAYFTTPEGQVIDAWVMARDL